MPDTPQIEVSEKVLAMNMSTILDLLQKYPIVTRKLLLIRPLRALAQMDPGEVVVNKVADALVIEANKAGWDVCDLKGNSATPTAIVNTINNWKPDFVVYYGHSYSSNIPGQENDQLKAAITPSNVSLLSNKTASITACHTMTKIGTPAINAGTIGYLGYKVSFTALGGSLLDHDFEEATNAANIALLNGEKYCEAKKKGYERWMQFYTNLVKFMKKNPNDIRVKKMDPTTPGDILANANGLDYVGDSNAVARPIGILLSTP